MFKFGLIAVVISAVVLTGCSTPQERAEARKRAYEMEQRRIQQREDGYKDTCASYGYEVGTPQFNQCVATERRQYEAEERDRRAAKERRDLEARLIRQANKEERRLRRECNDQLHKVWVRGRCL